MKNLMLKIIKKDIFFAFAISLVVVFIMSLFLGFLEEGIAIPLKYTGGDEFQWYLLAKNVIDNGWFWHTERLGYPYGQFLYDFPGFFLMTFDVLLIKAVSLICSSPFAVINFCYLLIFGLCTFNAYISLRLMEVKRLWATMGAILFATTPYIQARNISHFSLAVSYFVPFTFLISYWIIQDDYLQDKKRSAVIILLSILIGMNGWGYYAIFSCYIILIVSIISGLKKRNFKIFINSLMPILIITITFALQLVPVLLYEWKNGMNLDIAERTIAEGEIHGLKIAQLFIPWNTHGIKMLDEISYLYNNYMPLVAENKYAYLGLGAEIGFLAFVIVLLNPNVRDKRLVTFSRVNVLVIFLATVGGFSSLISLFFHMIRGYNRISIYLAFSCIMILVILLESFFSKIRRKDLKILFLSFASMFFIIALLEQLPSLDTRKEAIELNRVSFVSDMNFVRSIEKELGDNGCVYQLPFHEFPEANPVNSMADYQLFVGYLHSSKIKWSYGSIKNREGSVWNEYVSMLDTKDMLNALINAGFNGIYIDKRAYDAEEFEILLQSIEALTKTKARYSDDGYLCFVNISDYTVSGLANEEKLSVEQIKYYPCISGQALDLSVNNSHINKYLFKGFSTPEIDGTWTDGYEAEIGVRIYGLDDTDDILKVSIDVTDVFQQQSIVIESHGAIVYKSDNVTDTITFEMPIPDNNEIELKLSMPNAVEPEVINPGKTNDTRKLGIKLGKISFEPV